MTVERRSPARGDDSPEPAPLRALLAHLLESRPGAGAGRGAYAGAVAVVAACAGLAALMQAHFELSNVAMVFLLGVVVCGVAFGRGPAILAAVLGVAVFDFVFVPPHFTFRVTDSQYLVLFGVMLGVGGLVGTLTAWLREQLAEARQRERRTEALYRLSRDLAGRATAGEVVAAAAERIAALLPVAVELRMPDAAGELAGTGADREAAEWSLRYGQRAGAGSPHFHELATLYLPLVAGTRVLGVLVARPREASGLDDERRLLLESLASHTALALERCRLAADARRARAQAETERTRSALLSSVSHDLRTPLAVIAGAASSLRESPDLPPDVRRDLAETIEDESRRLERLIGNLLEMTRLESGTLRVRAEWHSIEEVVGAALARLERELGDRPVRVSIPADLPLVPLDDVLFEQVVRNLVENAHKHAPAASPIEIDAELERGRVRLRVADRGPGLPPGDEPRVFEKFWRGSSAAGRPGAGLGLAIARGIVEAHGGTIEARNRAGGGAAFTVELPLAGVAPAVEREPEAAAGARREAR